jgi:hypothetical protein
MPSAPSVVHAQQQWQASADAAATWGRELRAHAGRRPLAPGGPLDEGATALGVCLGEEPEREADEADHDGEHPVLGTSPAALFGSPWRQFGPQTVFSPRGAQGAGVAELTDLQVFSESRRGDSNPGPPPYHADQRDLLLAWLNPARQPGLTRTTRRGPAADAARYGRIRTVSAPNGHLGATMPPGARPRSRAPSLGELSNESRPGPLRPRPAVSREGLPGRT